MNFNWLNSDIGWKMANDQPLICTMITIVFTCTILTTGKFGRQKFGEFTHFEHLAKKVW